MTGYASIRAESDLALPQLTWHSWHLHVSSLGREQLDHVLCEAVGPLVDELRPSWFFVRYWLHGPHLRLRIADLDISRAAEIEDRLRSSLATACSVSPARPVDEAAYRRAAAPMAAAGEGGQAIDAGELWAPGVYAQAYEPELERYGGAALMPLNERVFHVSSETALDVVRSGDRGAHARGLEALAVSCAALPSRDPTAFLTVIRDQWTRWLTAGGTGLDADAVQRAAREVGERLGGRRELLLAAMHGRCTQVWAGWLAALRHATGIWQEALGPREMYRVYGSQVHMMANRLGVGAGGEAYLAAVLLHLLD